MTISLPAANATATELLTWAISTFGDKFAIATSFQKEGMAIVDMASRIAPRVRVFTLATGRLPAETYQMIQTVKDRYRINVELAQPDAEDVREMIALHGINLFRDSVESRRMCCDVRKVRPLERKLAGLQAWASGLRRGQSETRSETPKVDESNGRVKLNPVADWTSEDVETYTREHDVPVHPLYAKGYQSIGCAPCTRAVEQGEEERAGRWWWEIDAKKECGIHFDPDGGVRRAS